MVGYVYVGVGAGGVAAPAFYHVEDVAFHDVPNSGNLIIFGSFPKLSLAAFSAHATSSMLKFKECVHRTMPSFVTLTKIIPLSGISVSHIFMIV